MILLCVLFTYGSNCTEKTGNPFPPCGIGNGECRFKAGYLPQTYNCNYEGSFGIDFYPDTNSSLDGFNRLWFELERNGLVYRSNYVQFNPNDPTTQQLEWGGSLNTGSYEVKGYIKNIQLDSTCPDSVFREFNKPLGYISISEFNSPTKVMNIEYFCQDSDTGIIDRYDVFLSPNTDKYMNIAFNIANTRYNRITYDLNLTPELIEFDPNMRAIKDYIFNLKWSGNEMFLCGVKGFKDPQGNYLSYITGVTYFYSTPIPSCSTGSLIAVKGCIDLVANEYNIDYNDFVTASTIHELGHQRASILHSDNHDSQFCTMRLGLVVEGERNRYSNPHFCNNCINRLKNISW